MPATAMPSRTRTRRFLGLGRRAPRVVDRGRSFADDLGDFIDDAPPAVGRALGRRRSSGKRRVAGVMLLVTLVLGAATLIAWLAWREPRDEEFARLHPEPDEPYNAPNGSDGPAADAPRDTPTPAPSAVADPAPPAATPAPEPAGTPVYRAPGARSFGGAQLPRSVAAPVFAPARAPSSTRPRLPV